jgi:hypothetical protein
LVVLAYISLVPFWIAGTIALVMLFVAIAYWSRSQFAVVLAAIVLFAAASFWAAFPFLTGVERVVAHDMQWSYREPADEYPGADHILLTFTAYPDHHIGIYSKDLGDYLETLPSNDVRVQLRVTLGFGRTRGFHETQIGELKQWDTKWSYAGSSGSGRSPWP